MPQVEFSRIEKVVNIVGLEKTEPLDLKVILILMIYERKIMKSLKSMAESKELDGVQKTTQFQVDPRIIEIEDGFNARPIDPEHVTSIKLAYIAGSILPPLFVRVDAGRIILVDGHHRLAAIMELIADGTDVRRVDCMQFRGNDADRIAHMLTSAQGKALTPLEQGLQYRKLQGFGWSAQEIASKVGKSPNHVNQMLTLSESNSDVQGMVTRKEVAANVALDAVKKHGDGAGKVLAGHLEVAKAAGKTKVTASIVKSKFITDGDRFKWLLQADHSQAVEWIVMYNRDPAAIDRLIGVK
jgi:hypothetical protein